MEELTHARSENFYDKIAELLKQARLSVVQTVNKTMVCTYFGIGKMIVDEEQGGKMRAEYRKQILKELSIRLTMSWNVISMK